MSERKYTFVVEWFDPSASLIKQFYFTYFVPAQQIEMVNSILPSTILKTIKSSSRRYNTQKSSSRIYSSATWCSASTGSSRLWDMETSSLGRNLWERILPIGTYTLTKDIRNAKTQCLP